MALPPNLKQIRREDYDQEFHGLIDRLGYSLNDFMSAVIGALTGGINFVNLNQELKDVIVKVDSSGNVINLPILKPNVTGRINGILCIKADNLTNLTGFPTGMPWISYTISGNNNINVLNITNLQTDSEYRLKLLIIGD